MKRITLLVPDEMVRTVGSSRHSRRMRVAVSPEALVHALEVTDYHESYHFERDTVTVESIEEVEEEE